MEVGEEARLFRMPLKDEREGLSREGISLVSTHLVRGFLSPVPRTQLHTYSCLALGGPFEPSTSILLSVKWGGC